MKLVKLYIHLPRAMGGEASHLYNAPGTAAEAEFPIDLKFAEKYCICPNVDFCEIARVSGHDIVDLKDQLEVRLAEKWHDTISDKKARAAFEATPRFKAWVNNLEGTGENYVDPVAEWIYRMYPSVYLTNVGVFTKVPIKAGTVFVRCNVISVSEKKCIDRYINDNCYHPLITREDYADPARVSEKTNVRYIAPPNIKNMEGTYLQAIRDIAAGEELSRYYGEKFWFGEGGPKAFTDWETAEFEAWEKDTQRDITLIKSDLDNAIKRYNSTPIRWYNRLYYWLFPPSAGVPDSWDLDHLFWFNSVHDHIWWEKHIDLIKEHEDIFALASSTNLRLPIAVSQSDAWNQNEKRAFYRKTLEQGDGRSGIPSIFPHLFELYTQAGGVVDDTLLINFSKRHPAFFAQIPDKYCTISLLKKLDEASVIKDDQFMIPLYFCNFKPKTPEEKAGFNAIIEKYNICWNRKPPEERSFTLFKRIIDSGGMPPRGALTPAMIDYIFRRSRWAHAVHWSNYHIVEFATQEQIDLGLKNVQKGNPDLYEFAKNTFSVDRAVDYSFKYSDPAIENNDTRPL